MPENIRRRSVGTIQSRIRRINSSIGNFYQNGQRMKNFNCPVDGKKEKDFSRACGKRLTLWSRIYNYLYDKADMSGRYTCLPVVTLF
ncbi:hypothetical protein GDO81_019598 [Engystomops pustulosus]|uniref:Uncharacterized protein n=1 Tax=Engystomops pustulosus TaxID=76066 RepID=A0AAV6YZ63_ENGPU|nr:hypothetical protein GDO81_019598 [Engystomops pustulosus]